MPRSRTGRIADGGAAPRGRPFVNQLTLRMSFSQVELDLSQTPTLAGEDERCFRFVTTPDHLSDMHATVSEALDRYIDQFGPIVGARGVRRGGRGHG